MPREGDRGTGGRQGRGYRDSFFGDIKVKVVPKEVNILERVYEFCPGKDIVVSGESGPVGSHPEICETGIRNREPGGG